MPLIVNGPTLEGLGTRDFLVEHVDVFHSILRYVGITPPEKSRGQDIFSMARKGESLDRWIYSENTLYGDPMIAVTTKSHRLLLNQKTRQRRYGKQRMVSIQNPFLMINKRYNHNLC